MTTVTLDVETDVQPGRFIAALTDFSDRRAEVFRNLDPHYYRVHSVGDSWAEVTEGSSFLGGIWERVRYDWSKPGTVRIDSLEGNAFGAGSYWLYTLNARLTGAHIHLELRRIPCSVKGRIMDALLSVLGAQVFRRDLESTLARLRRD